MKAPRGKLTYANVTATLALFLVVSGGGAYAVSKIDGSDIRKRSLTSKQFKSNSLGRRVVRESSLRQVPRAANAARLGGQPAKRFFVGCPPGMIPIYDVCFETQTHPAESLRGAAFHCSLIDSQEGFGRRLPTRVELMVALANPQIQLASGGELTSTEVYPSNTPGKTDALYVTNENGDVGVVPDSGEGAKAFRCVVDPMN